MNYRTMLLATAAVLFSAQANAGDITNPFYLPTKGKVLSETTLQKEAAHYELTKVDGEHSKGYYASENVTLGVAEDVAVVAHIGNTFRHGDHEEDFNNDHNFDYGLGLKYNTTYEKLLAQFGAYYQTWQPRSFYGKRNYEEVVGNDRWAKALGAEVKLGYDAYCGFLPYTTFSVKGNIDNAKRYLDYSWFAGAHKRVDNLALDAGVRYNFTTVSGEHERQEGFVQLRWYLIVPILIMIAVFFQLLKRCFLMGKEEEEKAETLQDSASVGSDSEKKEESTDENGSEKNASNS